MPGPGRRGGHFGGGHRGHGWGARGGHGWGPAPIWRPFGPPVRGLGGVVGAVATGAVIAATLPPRRRRYPVPRPGYVYVVQGGTPRAMPVAEAPFIIRRIDIPCVAQGTQGATNYHVQVGVEAMSHVLSLRGSRQRHGEKLRIRETRIKRTPCAGSLETGACSQL